MKKYRSIAIIALVFTLLLAGCAGGEGDNPPYSETAAPALVEDEPLDGVVTEETGSVADYLGWWKVDDPAADIPFHYIEIHNDSENDINCYDKNGELIDAGWIDYSEQRELNGNPLMIFTFEEMGEYGVSVAGDTAGNRWMSLRETNGSGAGREGVFVFQEDSPWAAT